MKTTNHTPGPWIQCPGPDYGSDEHKRANQLYVTIGSAHVHVERQNIFGKVSDEDLANARLIASAPDLLAALEKLAEYMAYAEQETGVVMTHGIESARAAIAKAKGETIK